MGYLMQRLGCMAGIRGEGLGVATGDIQIASQGYCGVLGGRGPGVGLFFRY
jgi:hypothetical protein